MNAAFWRSEPGRLIGVIGGWSLISLITWLGGQSIGFQLIGFILWSYVFNAWRLKKWKLW